MLQFSDTSTKNGIIQRIEFDTNIGDAGISGDATLFAQFTAVINGCMSKATSIIMTADGNWTWDDSSHTDQAVAKTNIVSGQNDYGVLINAPGSTKDYLKVERVEAKDTNGVWYRLIERNLRRKGGAITQERTVTGQPTYYDFNGTSIFLDAIPNYSSEKGLKLWFSRAQINFTITDPTKRPGFASIFHEYPVLGGVYHWEKYKGVGNPEQTKRDMLEMEQAMKDFYSGRDKTNPTVVQRGYRKSFYR